MNIYQVRYDGLWLGGIAIVVAESELEAVRIAREDPISINFTDADAVKLCEFGDTKGMIIYNDNGNY